MAFNRNAGSTIQHLEAKKYQQFLLHNLNFSIKKKICRELDKNSLTAAVHILSEDVEISKNRAN